MTAGEIEAEFERIGNLMAAAVRQLDLPTSLADQAAIGVELNRLLALSRRLSASKRVQKSLPP